MATDPSATDIHFAESALAAVQYTASAATAIAVMVRGNMALEDQPRQIFVDILRKIRRIINSDATITAADVNNAQQTEILTTIEEGTG
mmetsp:Transcript_6146/g.12500  ORF Transcript_6146/g.12500 Transcript_6146/m.12500 type:complete len:88 (+) Transcript_6146:2697-2960(+)